MGFILEQHLLNPPILSLLLTQTEDTSFGLSYSPWSSFWASSSSVPCSRPRLSYRWRCQDANLFQSCPGYTTALSGDLTSSCGLHLCNEIRKAWKFGNLRCIFHDFSMLFCFVLWIFQGTVVYHLHPLHFRYPALVHRLMLHPGCLHGPRTTWLSLFHLGLGRRRGEVARTILPESLALLLRRLWESCWWAGRGRDLLILLVETNMFFWTKVWAWNNHVSICRLFRSTLAKGIAKFLGRADIKSLAGGSVFTILPSDLGPNPGVHALRRQDRQSLDGRFVLQIRGVWTSSSSACKAHPKTKQPLFDNYCIKVG